MSWSSFAEWFGKRPRPSSSAPATVQLIAHRWPVFGARRCHSHDSAPRPSFPMRRGNASSKVIAFPTTRPKPENRKPRASVAKNGRRTTVVVVGCFFTRSRRRGPAREIVDVPGAPAYVLATRRLARHLWLDRWSCAEAQACSRGGCVSHVLEVARRNRRCSCSDHPELRALHFSPGVRVHRFGIAVQTCERRGRRPGRARASRAARPAVGERASARKGLQEIGLRDRATASSPIVTILIGRQLRTVRCGKTAARGSLRELQSLRARCRTTTYCGPALELLGRPHPRMTSPSLASWPALLSARVTRSRFLVCWSPKFVATIV